MSIEAMKQALEALEYHQEQTRPIHKTQETITALRQAIEQAEKQSGKCGCGANLYIDENGTPCSKAPAKREWVGLTASEALACHRQSYDAQIGLLPSTFYHAIEAKLKERNT
jgi:hypothetical protein